MRVSSYEDVFFCTLLFPVHIFQSIRTMASSFYNIRDKGGKKMICGGKKLTRGKKNSGGWKKKLVSKTIKTKNELVNKNEIKKKSGTEIRQLIITLCFWHFIIVPSIFSPKFWVYLFFFHAFIKLSPPLLPASANHGKSKLSIGIN